MTTSIETAVGARQWWVMAVVCTAMFMAVLDSTSVYAALPQIATDLGFAPAQVQWVITAYGVSIGGLLLFGGRLADHLGRRRVFLISVGMFAGASLLAGLAWSSDVLIGARIAQGVGAAAMAPVGLAMVMTVFPEGPQRHRALGIWGGLGGTGATVGLLLGGVLTDLLGWQWIFFTNIPVCLFALIAGSRLLPVTPPRPNRLDLPGAVSVTGSLVMVLLMLFRIAEHGADAAVLLLAVGAVVMTVLFVAIERRSPAPLVPMRLLRSRRLLGGNAVIMIAGIAVDGLLLLVTLYAQQVLDVSALWFAVTMAIMTITSVIAVMSGQHLVSRIGYRKVATAGMALLVAACLLLSQVSAEGTLTDDLVMGLLVFGVGMGAAFVAGQIAALDGVAEGDSGVAAGLEETSFAIGTTLGAALASSLAIGVAAQAATPGEPAASALTQGIGVAMLVLAGLATLGTLCAVTMLRPTTGEVRV